MIQRVVRTATAGGRPVVGLCTTGSSRVVLVVHLLSPPVQMRGNNMNSHVTLMLANAFMNLKIRDNPNYRLKFPHIPTTTWVRKPSAKEPVQQV